MSDYITVRGKTVHWTAASAAVLLDVMGERHRQVERYGHNEDLPDGTDARWLWPLTDMDAQGIESVLRAEYESADYHGELSWMHLIREEVSEAFLETDPTRLRAELVQVAALAVSWIEKLDRRRWAADAEAQS